MKTKNKTYNMAMTVLLVFSFLFFNFLDWEDNDSPQLNSITWDKDPNMADTAEIVLAYANENGYKPEAYPDSLVSLLDRNPETKDFVLNYPREFQAKIIDLSSYANSEKLWDYGDICDQIRNLWVIRK